MLNLALMLEDSARAVPDRDALVSGDRRITYAELDASANQVANLLVSRGIRPGDKVALSCPNTAEFPVVYYGILKAGAVVVPLNVLLKRREIAYHLKNSGARAYFCFEGNAELPVGQEGRAAHGEVDCCRDFFLITADPAAASSPVTETQTFVAALAGHSTDFATRVTQADDTAVLLYTSGTTGRPKGAELTHANLTLNALTCHKLFGEAEHDVHLVTLPLFHSFGQTAQLNARLAARATLVLMPRFDAGGARSLMRRHQVTFFAGVPTMYWALLDHASTAEAAAIARHLRIAVSGGAALPIEIHRRFARRFHKAIREGYGLSETSPVATFTPPGATARPGSVGKPAWGVEVALIDADWTPVGPGQVGEIAIRGHNVMRGYHGSPEATAEVVRDGWFRTGDLARRDEDGWLYLVDRAKDLIIRGGFNVYPREIEEVLHTHPAVSMAAVVGVPHDRHGEEVKAFIVRAAGADVTEEDLVAWSRDVMAGHKYPRLIEFRDALPMNATGKILKRELRGDSAAPAAR